MKGEPTGKRCVRCDEPTVWKTAQALRAGFTPVCLRCKRSQHTSESGRASRRRADKVYRQTEPGIRAHRNSESRRRARRYLAECPECKGSEYYDVQRDASCYVCGIPAEATDHVYPLAKDGLHCNENFAPICQECNSAKIDRIWPGHEDWEAFVEKQKSRLTEKK